MLGEYHYAGLVRDPEYSRKARIGIAEIKIIQNKPLEARKILKKVLEEDPCDVQAKKNMGIAWYVTGDNYTSINILKSLPKCDDDINDINYNIAKAYYKIEKNDTALQYLQNNPLPAAKPSRVKLIWLQNTHLHHCMKITICHHPTEVQTQENTKKQAARFIITSSRISGRSLHLKRRSTAI